MAAAHLGFEQFAQEFFVGLTTALTRPPAQRWYSRWKAASLSSRHCSRMIASNAELLMGVSCGGEQMVVVGEPGGLYYI